MAATKGKQQVVRRRRERKNIENGAAHIQSTSNNTIVTITDLQGINKTVDTFGNYQCISEAPESPHRSQLRQQQMLQLRQLWSTVSRLLRFSLRAPAQVVRQLSELFRQQVLRLSSSRT